MNLLNLFEAQKVLRDRIAYNEPDRFNKLVLALLVELGECANEWRGFKFWSKDQEPRNFRVLSPKFPGGGNPLLEEYVDCLHFILEIGIEDGWEDIEPKPIKDGDITQQFISLFDYIGDFQILREFRDYKIIFGLYIELGEMLGFTWEQIEQAYFDKNKVNHDRQDSGVY